jgi:hypothetical protein
MSPHVAARLAEVDRQQQAAVSVMDHMEDQLSPPGGDGQTAHAIKQCISSG